MEPVEDAEDAFAQGCASNDGVVDYDECVNAFVEAAIGDVVDESGELAAAFSFGYEGSHFDVFPSYFFYADAWAEDFEDLCFVGGVWELE